MWIVEKNAIRLPMNVKLDFHVFECMTETVKIELQSICSLANFVREFSLDFNLCFKS